MTGSGGDAAELTGGVADPWSVAEVIAPIERAYPPHTAESWDRVGLAVGDPGAVVRRVLLTVDVTDAVLDRAAEVDAQLIVSHHPLLLHGIGSVRTDEPKGRLVTRLITSGIALYTAHTNADIAEDGTAAVLAATLGLREAQPLRAVPVRRLAKIVTYLPPDHLSSVLDALAAAGAGAIGAYDRCAFSSVGTGTFRPLPGATPFIGSIDRIEELTEVRLEMIMDRDRRRAVEAALLAAHPYQTPAYDVVEVVDTDTSTGLGRVGVVEPTTVGDFARLVAERVPCPRGAVRVAGVLGAPVRRVAVQAGAGDDLLDVARASGADLYLTSDLRHHPASEALARTDGPALIDLPHAAAESLWLPQLGRVIDRGLAPVADGREPPVITVSDVITDPWQHLF